MSKSIDDLLKDMQKNIKPLNMNGLHGRMLRLPAKKNKKKREIMLVYGHHATLERVYGIAEAFNDYGAVTIPDLPGCGGMDSFYKIGMKPTIDNMADYLAAFVKLKYKNKKVTIAGMSLGFVIVTRMLQRYPELEKNVDILISLAGFTHKYDFVFSKPRKAFYINGSRFFTWRLPSSFFYNVLLHPMMIKTAYGKTYTAQNKMNYLSKEEKKAALAYEVILWRADDTRTYMKMVQEMLTLDNCKKQIDLPVHHVSIDADQYLDQNTVEQHMRIVFSDYFEHPAKLPAHMPSILASKKQAAPFVPKSLRKVMNK